MTLSLRLTVLLSQAALLAASAPPVHAQDAQDLPEADSVRLGCRYLAAPGGDEEMARIDTRPAAKPLTNGRARNVTFERPHAGPQFALMQVNPGEAAECAFPSGRKVRVKVGAGDARAYGMCGGDPEVFMSVWVDGRKVESSRQIGGHCFDYRKDGGGVGPYLRIEVQRTGAANVARRCALPATDTPNRPLACTPYPDLAALPVDAAEYPPAGKRAARPGTIELLAGDEPVCTEARAALAEDAMVFDKYGKASKRFTYPAWKEASTQGLPKEFDVAEQSVFDLDNDGKPERVIKRIFENNYMDGDVLLARYGSAASPVDWQTGQTARTVAFLPCQMADKRYAIGQCAPLSQAADEANITMPAGPGKPPAQFRGRYLSVTPFFYAGKTWLGIMGTSDREYAAVIAPQPNGTWRHACLLHRVPKNF
jgi:hypothetical protein